LLLSRKAGAGLLDTRYKQLNFLQMSFLFFSHQTRSFQTKHLHHHIQSSSFIHTPSVSKTAFKYRSQCSPHRHHMSRVMDDIKSLQFLYCDDAVFGSTRLTFTNEHPRQSRLYSPPQMVMNNIQPYSLPINTKEALFGTTRLVISNDKPEPYQLYSPQSAWSTSSLSLSLERNWSLRSPSRITAKVFGPWCRKTADSITRLRRWSVGKCAR